MYLKFDLRICFMDRMLKLEQVAEELNFQNLKKNEGFDESPISQLHPHQTTSCKTKNGPSYI